MGRWRTFDRKRILKYDRIRRRAEKRKLERVEERRIAKEMKLAMIGFIVAYIAAVVVGYMVCGVAM